MFKIKKCINKWLKIIRDLRKIASPTSPGADSNCVLAIVSVCSYSNKVKPCDSNLVIEG